METSNLYHCLSETPETEEDEILRHLKDIEETSQRMTKLVAQQRQGLRQCQKGLERLQRILQGKHPSQKALKNAKRRAKKRDKRQE